MAPPPPPAPAAAGEAEEDLLEVRCAGCGETLEVERGLTEFICPDCSTPQALPPELMPPPPPRRRRALPIPSASASASAPAPGRHHRLAPAHPASARLPCGACGAMLGVPPGLARCGCPVCGAELAVDPARLRHYLLSTAAAPLVPVSLPPVFQALEGRQDYSDSALPVGHFQGRPNNQMGHIERSRARRQNAQALLEFPDTGTDSDGIDTEMSNEINEMPCHRNGFLVSARTVSGKGRQPETPNYVTCQVRQQSDHSVHVEHSSDHTIHAGEAQNESPNHSIHRGLGHTKQVTGTTIGPKSVSVEKRQVQTSKQMTQDRQHKTRPSKLPSPIELDPENSNDNIQAEQDEAEMGQVTAGLARTSTKRNLTSSNKGSRHRRSKRLAKQSAATTYYESPENESEENEAVSPSRTISDSQDIDGVSNGISSSSLPQQNMPHRRSNEADNLHSTTKSASILDMSDPESFARYYSKTRPPEVRRALERNLNLGAKEKRKRGERGPNLCLKVWAMPEGERIRVSFNDLGQPIGDEAGTLSSFLGQIARDGTVAPVTYTDWRYFPEKNKQAMMCLVNFKFVLPPIGQIWSMSALGKKWKDWKVALKHERYDAHETDEERLADRDFRVPEEQWKLLVAYWGTEKAKALSARCKASQEQHPCRNHPRIGSKSYARIREEERQKRERSSMVEVDPSLTDISIPAHTPKDDVASAQVVGPDQ